MKRVVVAVVAAAVITCGAVAAEETGSAEEVSLRTRFEQYVRMTPGDVVWGRESRHKRGVAILEQPYFTVDPNRVEVAVFTQYVSDTGKASARLTQAWRLSLPETVAVTWVPAGGISRPHRRNEAWRQHQRLYFAAERLGVGDKAHEVLGRMAYASPFGFKRTERRALLARRIGVDAEALDRATGHPEVTARTRVADIMHRDRWRSANALGTPPPYAVFPAFLINGKYFVHAAMVGHPRTAYRIANRLIREALERGRSHDGPTDNETLTDWMAPRSGEVFHRVRMGRPAGYRGVYSADRREFWDLDANGDVRHVHRLAGEGAWAYFTTNRRAALRYPHDWRFARGYTSYADEDGRAQRYGAFLLTDWLSAPDTLWVGLPFKGREVAMAFTSDGKVEAHNDQGSLFGTWWLEAGNLNVSFGEIGIESWPWREAAAHVGFEVPERSLTPWRSEPDEEARAQKTKREKKKRDWSAGGDGR